MHWFAANERIIRHELLKNQKFKWPSVIIKSTTILELWVNDIISKYVGRAPSLSLTDYRFSSRCAINEFYVSETKVDIVTCYERANISLISYVVLILGCISYIWKIWIQNVYWLCVVSPDELSFKVGNLGLLN